MKLENELDMVPKFKGLVWNQSLCRLLKRTREKTAQSQFILCGRIFFGGGAYSKGFEI